MKIGNGSYGNLTLHPGFRRFLTHWTGWIKTGLVVLGCVILSSCSRFSAAFPHPGYFVSVQQVVSGQALEVIGLEAIGQPPNPQLQGKRVKVRLIGIDAPDLQQSPWGEEARQFLEQRVKNPSAPSSDRIFLEWDTQEQDQYDRFLAYLWQGKTLINQEMVAAGQALVHSYFPNIRYEPQLESAQHQARLLGLGIWNPDRPLRQSPAEFRKN